MTTLMMTMLMLTMLMATDDDDVNGDYDAGDHGDDNDDIDVYDGYNDHDDDADYAGNDNVDVTESCYALGAQSLGQLICAMHLLNVECRTFQR